MPLLQVPQGAAPSTSTMPDTGHEPHDSGSPSSDVSFAFIAHTSQHAQRASTASPSRGAAHKLIRPHGLTGLAPASSPNGHDRNQHSAATLSPARSARAAAAASMLNTPATVASSSSWETADNAPAVPTTRAAAVGHAGGGLAVAPAPAWQPGPSQQEMGK